MVVFVPIAAVAFAVHLKIIPATSSTLLMNTRGVPRLNERTLDIEHCGFAVASPMTYVVDGIWREKRYGLET
jgi:hypothetical protein